jgi:hypothetical protein
VLFESRRPPRKNGTRQSGGLRGEEPSGPLKSGLIAVNVINDFGDEVLKVYPVQK